MENETLSKENGDEGEALAPPSAEPLLAGEPHEEAPCGEDILEEESQKATEEEAGEECYAALAEADLATLREEGMGLRLPQSLTDLSDPARYGALREAGLSPLEAYLATEGMHLLRERDGRTHLSPTVGRTAAPSGGRMATGDLLLGRDLFPSLSDGEIESLWRRARGAR